MESLGYRIKKAFLTVFGDIKVFPGPFWVIYQPSSFRIKGLETRGIMAQVQPGDVLMRGYVNYLDGYFIPKGESGCSHSGVYIGDGLMVHAIAEGAQRIDLIDFCRCDRIVLLRPASGQERAIAHVIRCADQDVPYDFNFKPGNGKYYCHELTASAYPDLGIQPLSRKVLGLFDSPVAYLADSFYTNPNFERLYESSGHRG